MSPFSEIRITERQRQLLAIIVEEYVSSARPVAHSAPTTLLSGDKQLR
jgi:hypothetical protein